MANKVLHKRNGTLNVAPAATAMTQGEIAMNYAKGSEKLYIKNSNNEIVSFPSSNELQEAERVTAARLIDLNEKIGTISADTASVIEELSGNVVTLSGNVTTISGNVTTLSGNLTTLSATTIENERIIAAAFVDLNEKVGTISADTASIENVAAAAIADLNAQIQVLKASITAINEQIVDLYSKQVTITGNTLNIS